MTEGSYPCEHSIVYKIVKSLCCTPEIYVSLYVNYTKINNNKKKTYYVLFLLIGKECSEYPTWVDRKKCEYIHSR